jgi:hypothetical protein
MSDTIYVVLGVAFYLGFVGLLTLLDERTLDRRR